MSTSIYSQLLKEYQEKRQKEELEAQKKKKAIYSKFEQIEKLQDEQVKISISALKNNMQQNQMDREIETENLQLKLSRINDKIDSIIMKGGHSLAEFEPNYQCNLCKDTGYLDNLYCSCIKQEAMNRLYQQSNMLKLKEENFTTFDLGWFADKANTKYGTDKSPRENILEIKEMALTFCEHIQDAGQKNLLFIGGTGLGKTFMSNCIADSVIRNGYTVIYQTAPILMDIILNSKYSGNSKYKVADEYNKLLDSDLLIIDDLGIESTSDVKFTELFNIINTRLLNNKKMIISTNLTLKKMYDLYDSRIISRLIGDFLICKFIGEDIRLSKKRIR